MDKIIYLLLNSGLTVVVLLAVGLCITFGYWIFKDSKKDKDKESKIISYGLFVMGGLMFCIIPLVWSIKA